MGSNRVPVLDGKVYGCEVSEEGLKHNRLDYGALGGIMEAMGGCILDNYIYQSMFEDFELCSGTDYDEEEDYYYDIYQYYIITDAGAEYLKEHTDEIVYYSEKLDINLWGVTHFGTGWSYVLTDVELVEWDEYWKTH